MPAIPVVLNGTWTDEAGPRIGVFQGTLAYSDRGPAHPIAPGGGPPVDPGYGYPETPVDPGYGIPERPRPPSDAHPEHPIVLPDPPTEPPTGPPDENGFLKPPPPGGGWAYHNVYAWMWDPPPGAATPKT